MEIYKTIWNKILDSEKIAIISHLNPDGDALGSSLSLYSILKKIGKEVNIVNVTSPLPHFLDFLPNYNEIQNRVPEKYDLMISCDCGSFDRLGIEERPPFLINIDHHISNTNFGDINLVEDAVSTSQVIFRLLKDIGVNIDKESAICLYTALVTDSGNFQYDNVDSEAFEMAAELLRCGVESGYVAKMLFERDRVEKLKFLSKALETLELFLEQKVACVEITKEMFEVTGATKNDSEGLVNMIRKVESVEVAMVLREEEEGVKVSLRSKNYVDVSKIAVKFGGGGHIRASGATIKGKGFEEIKNMILEELKGEL
jgi:phosphoesterase RecJ-like protein